MMIGILELCWIGLRMFLMLNTQYSMQLTASIWDLTSSIMTFLFKIACNDELLSSQDTGTG